MSAAPSLNVKPRRKIGFLHRLDARDIYAWSGALSFMAQALNTHAGEVIYLGPDNSRLTRFIIDNTGRINKVWHRFTGKSLTLDHNFVLSNRLGRFFKRKLRETRCDVIFAPVASVEIASLKTDIPIVYYSDITWADIVDYYPEFSFLSKWGRAQGERIEARAIGNARVCVYSSEWAVNSACSHYGASTKSVYKVSFGANLNDPPSRQTALKKQLNGPVNLLLVGVDWLRKGGPIAYECLTSLRKRGIDARLTLVGCTPPPGFSDPNFHVIPFLSKHNPGQRKQMQAIFTDAHFMLLPTRADATPFVISEASAFGLPILATDTGGLRGSIRENVNGFLLPTAVSGQIYADKILSVIADPVRCRSLILSTRNEYENSLNWDAWGKSISRVIDEVVGHRPHAYQHLGQRYTRDPLPKQAVSEEAVEVSLA